MIDFMNTKVYLYACIFFIMPLNGYIMSENPLLGAILILSQIPYLTGVFNDINFDKK